MCPATLSNPRCGHSSGAGREGSADTATPSHFLLGSRGTFFLLQSPPEVLDPSEASQTEVPPLRRPTKDDPKKNAVWQHRQEIRTKMKSNKADDVRPPPVKLTQCQQELDHVLERIARMPFSESRGPLEELYALHIPNCDKRGQYNVKQCKMSVHGQRGECWCVNPHTGRQIATSPMVRGDPNCGQHLGGPDMEPPAPLQK